MKYLALLVAVTAFSLCSCDTGLGHEYSLLRQSMVTLVDMDVVEGGTVRHQDCAVDTNPKFVVYFPSSACAECQIAHLSTLNRIYNFSLERGSFAMYPIFSPSLNTQEDLIAELLLRDYGFPVYVDYGEFTEANPSLPTDPRLACFLLDGNGHPLFVGDPLSGKRMWRLFEKSLRRLE